MTCMVFWNKVIIMAVQTSGCPEWKIKTLAGQQTVTSCSIDQKFMLTITNWFAQKINK